MEQPLPGKACPGHDEVWPCAVLYFTKSEMYPTWVMLALLLIGPVVFMLYMVALFLHEQLLKKLMHFAKHRTFHPPELSQKVSFGEIGPILFEISPTKMEHYRPKNDPFRQQEEPKEEPAKPMGFIVSQMISACDSSDVRNRGKNVGAGKGLKDPSTKQSVLQSTPFRKQSSPFRSRKQSSSPFRSRKQSLSSIPQSPGQLTRQSSRV